MIAIVRGVLLTAAIVFGSGAASAREFRVDEIPNGKKRGCLNCHLTTEGEHFTSFGSDVKFSLVGAGDLEDQHVDWSAIYDVDSDGDTFTNGEELGDPSGVWTIGSPNPPALVTHPGSADIHPPGVCDNGVLEPDEDCDTGQIRVATCDELGLGTGVPACGVGCGFDLAGCSDFHPPASGEPGTPAAEDDPAGCTFGRASHRGGPFLYGALASFWLATRRRRNRARTPGL